MQEYLDNSLSVSEREDVAAHLEGCDKCRHGVETYAGIFKLAADSARKQMGAKVSHSSLAAVMQRIHNGQQSASIAAKPGAGHDSGFSIWLKWLMIPALAVIMLFVLSVGKKDAGDLPENNPLQQAFSLAENMAVLVMGKLPPGVTDRITLNREVRLAEDAILLVTAAQHKFKFFSGAVFAMSQNEITLAHGAATFDLTGFHEGFRVKTPVVTVTPLGTSFELALKSWGVVFTLHSGRAELVSSSGLQRSPAAGQTLYVTNDGSFSERLPQPESLSLPVPPAPQQQPLPTGSNSSSPGNLIDSF